MEKLDFNKGWSYRHLNSDEQYQNISLPHDALIYESRSNESDGGVNISWFIGKDYEYRKIFKIDPKYQDKVIVLEFEGVYHNAEIYLNDIRIKSHPYGYTNFFIDITTYLHFDEDNELIVIATNSDQPNSRWYSGAGIYRPVNLYVLEKERILPQSVKITTLDIDKGLINIFFKTTDDGEANIELFDDNSRYHFKVNSNDRKFDVNFEIKNPILWDINNPHLYHLKIIFKNDVYETTFGIRSISFSSDKGFLLNNKRVILRGACIHSDNGVLGARCFKESEYRKIKLLKENGYNAIRSAHNPSSKWLLEASDRLGMLVMDEYVDMWYIHKTRYDYASYIEDWYDEDLKEMINKDYNHPSVIMYSLGNEVAETGEKEGIEFFKRMRDVCHQLDSSRPVTVGVNIFFNYLYSLGFGVYSDKKAYKNPQKKVGSEFFNNLAGIFGDGFMKHMAKLRGCDRKTKDCFKEMDIAGYNYGILRYKKDVKKYSYRIIVGSETFCGDTYKAYELMKKYPQIIGDFVWAGMDYLGEVGVGAWEYKEYAKTFKPSCGWISSGSGRLNLIGSPLGEALYTKVAYDLEDKPLIAVVPVHHTSEKHSPSAWKFSNALESWTYPGYENKKAKVEVYSKAPIVELYVNGEKKGRKRFKKNCVRYFITPYKDGVITAVNLSKDGHVLSKHSLFTAKEETILSLIKEDKLSNDDIYYIKVRFTDRKGILKPLYYQRVDILVQGGELLGAGNASPYNEEGYNNTYVDTYYGEALIVVKKKGEATMVKVQSGDLSNSITL